MRIHRSPYRSRLRFRARRRTGCLSSVVLLGVLVGVGALSWEWLNSRLPAVFAPVAPSASSNSSLVSSAYAAFAAGDLDSAIAGIRAALEAEPHRPDAVTLAARALVYRSYADYNHAADRRLALELTTAAAAARPRDADVLAAHAFAQAAAGNAAAAAETAERALTLAPLHSLARTARALAYGGAGSFETALRESQRAAEGDPAWRLDAERALAIGYSDVGDYGNALRVVESAIRQHGRLAPLYYEQALYAMQLGDVDTATQAYYTILTFDPDNVKVRLRLCEVSSLLREGEAALRYCGEVTARAPSWADGWYALGREHFLQGRYAAAQDDLHRCAVLQVMQGVPVSERRFECWYLQGQAAEILGDCAALVTTYNEFREMIAGSGGALAQTWTYPPEGPPCAG